MYIPPEGEDQAEPELIRRDDALADPSNSGSIPTASSTPNVRYARTRTQALRIQLSDAVRRAFQRPPAPLVFDGIVEDNIADNGSDPIPTIDASPLVIRRPHQGHSDDNPLRADPTQVTIGVKVLDTIEVMVGFVSSKTYLIRAVVYTAVVGAALGAVALLSIFIPDVPDPVLAVCLWGLLVLLVGGPVYGIGLWFVDKRHDHDDTGKHHR